MATPNQKLAASLAQLQKLQGRGRRVFRSGELTRVHRERLVRNGFLREVMKGWLISFSPDADPGDTTPWFAFFWDYSTRRHPRCGWRARPAGRRLSPHRPG